MNNNIKNLIFKKIISILLFHGAKRVAIFGSYARDEETSGSDLDILVKFKDRKGLLKLVQIESELSQKLQIKVDLLTEKSISPYLIDQIKNEEKVIYDSK